MKDENVKALNNLGKTAYRSGILPIFLGLLIGFIGLINNNAQDMTTGLFVFVVGYAFIKISAKLAHVVKDESSS